MSDHPLKRRRRAILVYLYVIWALWGIPVALFVEPAQPEAVTRVAERAWLILSLAGQLGFMWFCTVDAKLAGRPLIRLARIGIFLGWPIGVPIYLLWARGLRGLGTLLLHGVLLLLVWICSALAVTYLCYGPEWFA